MRNRSSGVVLLPSGSELVLLSEDLVDGLHTKTEMMLLFQVMLNLLSAALTVYFSKLPDPALTRGFTFRFVRSPFLAI